MLLQRRSDNVTLADSFETYLEGVVRGYDGTSPVYEMIRYHFGYGAQPQAKRGKRLRAQLLLRVAVEEGAPAECALDAAVAIEVLHNYSLVHDDIEDGDELRHGRTTVWSKFGMAHGINAGDSLCAISYLSLLANASNLPSDRIATMTRTLHEANLEMCAGQGMDISFESAERVRMADYAAMINGKTAALFAASCELGALAAGASPERARDYGRLGRAYGLAFQIRDDVLGTWGLTEQTGKPSGADIARRKWTFPVVWALDGAPSAQRDVVAERYAQTAEADADSVRRVIEALDALGARSEADRAERHYLAEADTVAAAAEIDRSGAVREFLNASARRVA